MSVPRPGRTLTVLGAESSDPDGTEQYRFLALRGILRAALIIHRM